MTSTLSKTTFNGSATVTGPTLKNTMRARGRSTRGVTNLHPLQPSFAETARTAGGHEPVHYIAGGTPRALLANSSTASLAVTLPSSHVLSNNMPEPGAPKRWPIHTPDITRALHEPLRAMRKKAPDSILSKKPKKSSGWVPRDEMNNPHPEDSAAVDDAIQAIKGKMSNMNLKKWLADVEAGNIDGKTVSARQNEITAMLPSVGVNLTPSQQKLLLKRFFSAHGKEVSFSEFASKVRPDRGYVPDAAKQQMLYEGKQMHGTTASTIPSVKAETAKKLFKEYMEPRRLRTTLKSIGISSDNSISYGQFRAVLKTINIRLQDHEFDKLCKMFDPDNTNTIYLADSSFYESNEAIIPSPRGPIPQLKQGLAEKPNHIDPFTALVSPRSGRMTQDEGEEFPIDFENTIPEVQSRLYNLLNTDPRRLKYANVGKVPFGYHPSDYDVVTSPYMVGEAPTRYGMRESLRYNTARTVAPAVDNPILPYAQASQAMSHFDTGSNERYMNKADAIRQMQIEDKKALSRGRMAKRAVKADHTNWENERQRMTDESLQRAFQLRIDNLVSQRLQYAKVVSGGLSSSRPGANPGLTGDWIGGGENPNSKLPPPSEFMNSKGLEKSISWENDGSSTARGGHHHHSGNYSNGSNHNNSSNQWNNNYNSNKFGNNENNFNNNSSNNERYEQPNKERFDILSNTFEHKHTRPPEVHHHEPKNSEQAMNTAWQLGFQ